MHRLFALRSLSLSVFTKQKQSASFSTSLLFDDTQLQVRFLYFIFIHFEFQLRLLIVLLLPFFFPCFHSLKKVLDSLPKKTLLDTRPKLTKQILSPRFNHLIFMTVILLELCATSFWLCLILFQEVNLWKLMGDFNLHGITAPGIV